MRILLLLLTAAIAYGLGSINGAILAARFVFRRDVRDYGSGNAGLTNYYRTFGVPGMAMLIAIDVAKSAAAVLIGGGLLSIVGAKVVGKLFAAFCLMMGHIYPAFHHFRGGKGVLCGVTAAFMVDWRVGVCCMAAFLITVIFSRYVSLGSMIGALLWPLSMWAFRFSALEGGLALFCALLLIVKHIENIIRLIGGTEPKLETGGSRSRRRVDDEDMF